jgi:hypothetical protein
MEGSLRKVFFNVPLSALNVLVFARALIRTAVAAGVALLISIGIFAVGDAYAAGGLPPGALAEEMKRFGAKRAVVMECPGEKEKKIDLKVIDETVHFGINGCYCVNELANAKKKLLELLSGSGSNAKDTATGIRVIFGPIAVEPGKSIKKTYYCYSAEQIEELLLR